MPTGFHGEELGLSLHVPREGLGAELRLLSYFLKTRWVPPTAIAPSGARLGGRAPHAAWGMGGWMGTGWGPPASEQPSNVPAVPNPSFTFPGEFLPLGKA